MKENVSEINLEILRFAQDDIVYQKPFVVYVHQCNSRRVILRPKAEESLANARTPSFVIAREAESRPWQSH